MEHKANVTRALPYIGALILFLVVTIFCFTPQFQGKELVQHDIMQYEGMTRDILQHREAYGEDPQWAGNMFAGMPAYLINMKYDGALVKTVSKAFYFLGQPAALIFLAMAMFFCMLLCMKVNPWIGLIPSLAYGFSTYFFIIIGAGHMTKMMVLAFAPMLFGGVWYAFRRNMWVGAALVAFFGSIMIGANHPQITYYFLMIIAAFWISELVRAWKEKVLPRFAKVTGLLLVAGVLAVGSNAGMLYYIQTHSKDTIRGGSELKSSASTMEGKEGLDLEYATAWSYGKGETFNLLIPNLYGGSSEGGFSEDGEVAQALSKYGARNMATHLPAYWGPQPITSGPMYIGAVVLFLGVLGLFLLRRRSTLWISVIALLAILLAWGKNMMWFTELFYHYFPMYDKFRTVSTILVIVGWCVPLLAALTLQRLWSGEVPREKLIKGLKYTTIILGGITLLFLLFGGILLSFTGEGDSQMFGGQQVEDVFAAMRSERASLMRADALRSLLFIVLTAGTVLLFYLQKIKRGTFVCVLGLLVIFDMVPVNLRYLSRDKFVEPTRNEIRPSEADQQIMADKELGYRVLNMTVSPFNDATTSYFHRSVGGYHGAKLRRYQDLIEHYLGKMDLGVYNMLNTKYVIVPDEKGQPLVQLNPEANGAAWFVDSVRMVDGPDVELAALGGLDNKRVAVVDKPFAAEVGDHIAAVADSTDTIAMTEYRVNLQRYEYTASSPRVAVFSEIYYPKGWTAWIDGKEASYFRADYVLRAMVLPEGTHTVEFRFRAPHYTLLSTVTLISSLILLAGVVAAVGVAGWRAYRKQKEDVE